MRGLQNCRGFTLIEVLVALVVLMIGVYAMLRIFPPGFTAIELSQQRTAAAQLAEAELARWKLHPESLPDAIIATDYQGNPILGTIRNNAESLRQLLVYARNPLATGYRYLALPTPSVSLGNLDYYARALIYSPLDLTPTQFDAALGALGPGELSLHPDWEPNSLYLPRTVIGERIDIRRLGTTASGVLFYLLAHAPLDPKGLLADDPDTPEYDPVLVQVYDAQPWTYAPQGRLQAREFRLEGQTLVFGPEGVTPAQAQVGNTRVFRVDYTDPTTKQRVPPQLITATYDPQQAGAWKSPPELPVDLDARTIVVQEMLQAAANEEALWNQRNLYLVDPQTTITGRIRFSPLLQTDPAEVDISIAKVDYRVQDWAILGLDVEVPPDGIVRLPIGHVKGPGFTNPPRQPRPQEVARGIKPYFDWQGNPESRSPLDPNTWAYVVAVNLQDGEYICDHEGLSWPVNAYERKKRVLVNFQEGILDFNYEPWEVSNFNPRVDAPDRAGRTYRIFCRGEADWALQLLVTPRRYGRSSTGLPGGPAVGPEASGSLVLTYAWRPDKNQWQLYFPLSEAGHTVAIDYYLEDHVTGKLTFVEAEIHTIGKPKVTDLGEWVCPLEEELCPDRTRRRQQGVHQWGPLTVRGISVRARASWVSPGRAFLLQDLVSALDREPPDRARASLRESWHQVIVDTYLTRTPI